MQFAEIPQFHVAGRFAETKDCEWHVHKGHELVFVTEGHCHIWADNKRMEGKTGTLFVLPAGVRQYQETHGFTRTSYTIFSVSETLFDSTPRTIEIEDDRCCARWLEDICDLNLSHASPGICEALLLAFLRELKALENQQQASQMLHPALTTALAYMEERLDSPLNVTELAAHTHFSASHLRDLFQRQWGVAPHAYHLRWRLDRATRLLKNPYLSIAEVGRTCGFDDANYFARQFNRHYDISPAAYRRLHSVTSSPVKP